MNILHVINLDTVGGVEELFVHFIQDTSDNHHLLITGGKIHTHLLNQIEKHTASITYEKYVFGIKIPKWPKWFLSLRESQRRRAALKGSIECVILWNRIESIADLKKVLPPVCKFIYYEHGASWIEKSDAHIRNFFSSVDAIFANSQAAKKLLELKWKITKPISVIQNPLRPDLKLADEGRTMFQVPFCMGYIGRLIPLKGVQLLLHALKLLLEKGLSIRLIIAGDGEEKIRLQKEATVLGISHFLEFRGIVIDVESFYDEIDLLVIPSIREPLGLVALEANARGCPVVATSVDGLPETVIEGKTGFLLEPTLPVSCYPEFGGTCTKLPDSVFNPKNSSLQAPQILDPAAIAERIEYLISHPEEYSKISLQAIEQARQRPSFSEYAKTLCDLIVRVMQGV